MKSYRTLRLLVLTFLVTLIVVRSSGAKSKVEWQTYSVAQLKAAMSTLGTGEHARVIVTMLDGTKLTGHVSQADDSHFVVVVSGRANPVEYDQVSDIRAGNPDTQVKFAARITTDAAALAAGTPSTTRSQRQHQRLSAAAKATVILVVTAGGIVLSLALLGKL